MKLNNPLYQIFFWFLAIIILALMVWSCNKPISEGHQCKWSQCPYKGINELKWHEKVQEYVGNNESFSYSLDILHLHEPSWEYEQLEDAILTD